MHISGAFMGMVSAKNRLLPILPLILAVFKSAKRQFLTLLFAGLGGMFRP